jgi:hypothetical protein
MIIISPFAKKMRNNKPHPKDYPFWEELIKKIPDSIVQVGVEGEKQLVEDFRKNLSKLIHQCDTWIAVDSFFQHLCWDLKKPGIVLFGQSDPLIFGHPENINLLKSRLFLREKQFWLWEQCEANDDAFVSPNVVLDALLNLQNTFKNRKLI